MHTIHFNEEHLLRMLSAIEHQGYYVQTDLIAELTAFELRKVMDDRYEQDLFKKAGVGKGALFTINENVRRDSILWIENPPENSIVGQYSNFISELIPALNRYFFLPLKDKELMFALYEPGSFYKRHRDRFEQNQHRFFTTVLYLTDWKSGDGGELVLYLDDETIKVEPEAGTFLFFRSEIEHEVLPALANRYSITGWITDVPIGLTFL